MKLNVKWFSITGLIMGGGIGLILFIWCSANGFGLQLVQLFESIHPSGGLSIVANISGSFVSKIPGIIVNTVYASVDSFIITFCYSGLYNLLISRASKK